MQEMIPKVSIALDEQETVYNLDPVSNGQAFVYTCMPRDIKRFWKLMQERPDEVKLIKDDKYGCQFTFPMRWIKIRPNRILSEEEKIAVRERLTKSNTQQD